MVKMRFLFCLLVGSSVIVTGVMLQLTWFAFCFGSVIIGILLLLFAPGILLFPFTAGMMWGLTIIEAGSKK